MDLDRNYIILNSNDATHIVWSQVCEISIDAVRWSNNYEKILLSYRRRKPSFIDKCQGWRIIDKANLRKLTSTSTGWCNIEEEIN
jgi:hypothetical protein